MKKMPLIRLEPSKKMVNFGFVPLVVGGRESRLPLIYNIL